MTHFINLEAPTDVLITRYPGKRVDPETGDIYHELYLPAPPGVQTVKVETVYTCSLRYVPDDVIADMFSLEIQDTDDSVMEKIKLYRRHSAHVKAAYSAFCYVINADQKQVRLYADWLTIHSLSLT